MDLLANFLVENWDMVDQSKVLGPLVTCIGQCGDFYCLRHDAHYAECSCPGLSPFDEEEDELT